MPSPTTNHQPRTTAAQRRPAFTLTELLVVIAIIAVLASLVSVGVMRALDTARQATIKTELDQIDMALRAYKDKYGEYPPCDLQPTGLNLPLLKRHIARAFPRYDQSTLSMDLTNAGVDTNNRRPDQALVFWLSGFNPDPAKPFDNLKKLTKAQRKDQLFDFDESRLIDMTTMKQANIGSDTMCPSYVAKGVKNNAPYVYFDGGTIVSTNNMGNRRFTFAAPLFWNPRDANPAIQDAGFPMPYFQDANQNGVADNTAINGMKPDEDFVNTETFQLIAPGIDGKYSSTNSTTLRLFPTGIGYAADGTEDDNVVNFTNKARLVDAKP